MAPICHQTVRQAKVHIRRIVGSIWFLPGWKFAAVANSILDYATPTKKAWKTRTYTPSTGRLAQIMNDAVHDGLLAKSPCSRRSFPHLAQQRVYVATTEQVWELYELFPERMRLAVVLGAFVGLRLGEACGLRAGRHRFPARCRLPKHPVSGGTAEDQDLPDLRSRPGLASRRADRSGHHLRPTRVSADRCGRSPTLPVGHRAGDAKSSQQGPGPPSGLPVPRPTALLRQPAYRLGRGRQDRPGAAAMPAPRPPSTPTGVSGPTVTSRPGPPSTPSSAP